MTTLFSWTGIDTHGQASIYIASDSRISWGGNATWDVGRKVFSSRNHPEIFGYCGAVAFPIQVLGQLTNLIDDGLLFDDSDTIKIKIEKIKSTIKNSLMAMPSCQRGTCEILYATRIGNRMNSSFHAAIIKIRTDGIYSEEFVLPEKSGLIASSGSGSTSLKKWHDIWVGNPNQDPFLSGRTSRNVFSAFCDSLASKQDTFSGGAPQLVGIYREGAAKNFGVIYNNKRYLNGLEVPPSCELNSIEWRNELFERCCGNSMNILGKAQRQPRLKGLLDPYS
ncbi:hypothetical protein [Klebsiella aerogenes]|uniref:hypothetical protein n=1 Tax=Klebsiella aerogenes TaxID=548 RepID=UPI001868470C|nr:hypothetical protein [Klebsiella aerogenes]HBW0091094.1 hypothetical protein [Klebsiella aerogenes]